MKSDWLCFKYKLIYISMITTNTFESLNTQLKKNSILPFSKIVGVDLLLLISIFRDMSKIVSLITSTWISFVSWAVAWQMWFRSVVYILLLSSPHTNTHSKYIKTNQIKDYSLNCVFLTFKSNYRYITEVEPVIVFIRGMPFFTYHKYSINLLYLVNTFCWVYLNLFSLRRLGVVSLAG